MQYRREIDGLRTVAVLPVIFFHAGFEIFNGGFVGVDVFFVISGYLITTLIIKDLEGGKFSLRHFYERRARRILPAMFLVMVVCLPFAWAWLLPEELKKFSQSLIAVSMFGSNIFFWRRHNYFESESDLMPLLHTWSLGVEEQFYILFPLFLLLAWRLGAKWVISLMLTAALASIALAQWGSVHRPTAAFFLLPTRGWELAMGFFVACILAWRGRVAMSQTANQLFSLSGLFLILYSVFEFSEKTPFPSLYALAPTLGAALIILFAWPRTAVGRLLGNRMLVGTGLVSYSAYLWHQPLFSFARHKNLLEPAPIIFVALIILTFILAYLSWRFVERPFKTKGVFNRRTIFALAATGSIVFILIGYTGHKYDGFTSRLSDELLTILDTKNERQAKRNECHSGGDDHVEPEQACVLGNSGNVVGALLGDSHAFAITKTLDNSLTENGFGLNLYSFGGCPPVLGVYRIRGEERDLCHKYNERVFELITGNKHLKNVVILARYSLYIVGTPFDNQEGWRETVADLRVDILEKGEKTRHREPERRRLVAGRHAQTVQRYLDAGKRVILVYPVPEVGWNTPNALVKRVMNHMGPLTTSYRRYKERNFLVTDAFDALGAQNRLVRIRPDRIFCDVPSFEHRCITHVGLRPLYDDDDHLSNFGAGFIVEPIIGHLK